MSNLDLFAIVLGHICIDVTLASRDGWEYKSVLDFRKGRRFVGRDYSSKL
jgi:hypothetical protein